MESTPVTQYRGPDLVNHSTVYCADQTLLPMRQSSFQITLYVKTLLIA